MKIQEWAAKWKVIFSPAKSKDIIFSRNKVLFNSPPLVLNNTYISRVHQHKHLGVWLTSSLDWSKQIHEACLKANGKLAVLRSCKFLDRATLDLLYKLTIRSVLEYGIVIFFHSLKLTDKAWLAQVQYRAAKLCTGALHLTSQIKLEKDLSWETISDRADFLALCLFHKIALHMTRPLIRKCMPILNEIPQLSRASNRYKPSTIKQEYFLKSFFPQITLKYNELKKELYCERDISEFKSKLKLKYKNKKIKHYNRGISNYSNSLHTQLRVGRSYLHAHGFVIGLEPSDLCLCWRPESVNHYFHSCFLYQSERELLYSTVSKYIPNFNTQSLTRKTEILLNGINLQNHEPDPRNIPILFAVQTFILQTKRFSTTSS